MLLGHYAAGLAAKSYAPKTNLGLLIAAAVFLDILWPLLLSLRIERVAIAEGASVVTPLFFYDYPWSHSLVMAAVWGLSFGGLYFLLTRYPAGAIALGVLVTSHWFIDLPVHLPDLPLTPWTEIRMGFSLWNSVLITFLLEFGLFAAGIYIYVRATRVRNAIGYWGLIAFVVLGVFLYLVNFSSPPPPGIGAIIIGSAIVQGVFVLLALWTDRGRAAA
jgi:hypothetical protein